jgi:hypothetical protein
MSRKSTLDLRALFIKLFVKLDFHLTPIRFFRPFASSTAIQRDHGLYYVLFLPTVPMVGFPIISSIGQHCGEADRLTSLFDNRNELRGIIAGTTGHNTSGKQVGIHFTDGRDFGPGIP